MSLAIDVGAVVEVLLADGWHKVAPGVEDPTISSFYIDAYEYVEDDGGQSDLNVRLAAGQEPLLPRDGFVFCERGTGYLVFGPLTALLAVRCRKAGKGLSVTCTKTW